MADEATVVAPATPAPATAAPAAPAAAPAPVTASAAPAPGPGAESTSAPSSSAVTPPAESAPAVTPPTPATPAAAKPAAETPSSLLGDAKPATDAKPAEAPATAEPPAPAETPVAPPAYEPFTLPEGVTLEAERVSDLTKLLGETELATKADHAAMQGLGQKLIDLYVAESKRVADAQQQSWIRTRDEWRNTFIADEQIGGARREATLRNCAQMIEQFGGSPEQQAELRQAFGITGMGDHPALIRLLNNMASVLVEPKPVPATAQRSPVPASKSARRYSNSLNGAN